MNLLDSINQFLRLFIGTFRQFGRGRIWLPLVAYFALQWLVLYAHYDFLRPPFYNMVTLWTSFFGSEMATAYSHYPQHFLLLGQFSGWAKLGVGLILEGLVLGMVAGMFHHRITGSEPGRSALNAWLDLVLVWVVINGLMLIAGMFLPGWLGSLINSPRRLLALNLGLLPFLYTLIFALFFMAIPMVMVRGYNGLKAIVESVGLFIRRPFTFFCLATTIVAGPILLGAIVSRPAGIVDSFKPELVYWLLVASLVVEMIAYFFWMGTAVIFLNEDDR
ncbi:MAG: hypothetical protein J7J98_05620 [candidate division Zixibacteria bacterium]|nr:hypothetical protein [candidate division Zixibacteria bacterium]